MKKEEAKIKNLFDLDATIAKDYLEKFEYPWEALAGIKDYILELGATLGDDYKKVGEDVWIHKTANVFPSAYIHGPAIICEDAEVRHCAFIRGSAIIGKGATVGNSTEVKNAIVFAKAEIPHYNYVGDSIIGIKGHMGAGSICSNLKSDGKNLVLRFEDETVETGIRKIGAFIGDRVQVGCGAVLNPGTILGRDCNVYPLSSVRGMVDKMTIYKKKGQVVKKY